MMMDLGTYCVAIVMVVFSGLLFRTGANDPNEVYVVCQSEVPTYPSTEYCYVEEGEAVLINGYVDIDSPTDFENAVLTTGGPLPEAISGVDDATPILDFAPIVVESKFDFSAKIELVDDCDVENDEAFVMDIEPYNIMSEITVDDYDGAVIIKDNDDNYRIENEHYDVMESDGTFEFKVTRTGVLATYSLEYSTCDITAQSGSDFVAVTQGSIDFADGAPSAMGTVDIVTDQDTEVTEVFGINIVYNNPPEVTSGCRGKVIPPSKAYVTIHDSADTSKAYYWIEECRYSVIEPESGKKPFTFTIRRKGNTADPSIIEFAIRAVSASPGFDYEAPSTSVTFEANDEDADATVNIIADSTTETPEAFEVSIADPSIRKVSSYYKAVVIIQDVATTKSCVRFDSSVYVALESSQQVTLTIQREGNLDIAGMIRIMTEDVDASSIQDVDFVSKTSDESFSANQQQKQVTITIKDDMIKEDTECFKVKLQKIDTLDVCTQETQVQIKDDDDEFRFEGTVFRVHEDERSIDVYIERTGYLGKVSSVRVENVAGSFPNSATLGADFNLPSATTIQFAANQRRRPVAISITSESPAMFEGEEEVTLMLAPSTPFLQDQIGVPHEATIVIVDQFGCNAPCLNGGTCIADNTCGCPSIYIGDRCQRRVKIVDTQLTITNMEFSQDLYDENSARFVALKAQIEEELTPAFSSLSGFMYVALLSFEPGSVIVRYRVVTDENSNSNIGDVAQIMDALVNNDLSLGSSGLQVQQTDTNTDCPVDYCSNGGTCLEAGNIYYCQCLEGFIGSTCLLPVVPPDDADDSATDDGLSGGAIAGIILGILAGLLGIGIIVICLSIMFRNGQKQPQIQQQQFDLRPYSGANQAYAMNDGVLGVPPLY